MMSFGQDAWKEFWQSSDFRGNERFDLCDQFRDGYRVPPPRRVADTVPPPCYPPHAPVLTQGTNPTPTACEMILKCRSFRDFDLQLSRSLKQVTVGLLPFQNILLPITCHCLGDKQKHR